MNAHTLIVFNRYSSRCVDGFALAKYYGSYMVLQRAPARPRIWGYADNIGDTVEVAIVGRETVTATATLGKYS